MSFADIFLAGPYNAALATAVAVALALAIRRGAIDGHHPVRWAMLLAIAVTAGLVGSKILFFDLQPAAPGEKTILGGILLGLVAVSVATPLLGLHPRRSMDSLLQPALVAMAIGRVGCFVAGCCGGSPVEGLPWDAHPVQLYEGAGDLLLLGGLSRRAPRFRAGELLGWGVVGYAVVRFLAEFFRAGRESVGGLNVVQWMVLAMGLGVLAWTMIVRREGPVDHRAMPGATVGPGVVPALVVASLIALAAVEGAFWFTPLEQALLVGISSALALHVASIAAATLQVWRSGPVVGALLLLQQPAEEAERRTEILVSAGSWRGAYEQAIGYNPAAESCQSGTYTTASRETAVERYSAGIRQRIGNARLRLEGVYATGYDRVHSIGSGTVDSPPQDAVIDARGLDAGLEFADGHLRVTALQGRLSDAGVPVDGATTFAANVRMGSRAGLFLEAQVADARYAPAVADVSFVALGARVSPRGTSILLGYGAGVILGAELPLWPGAVAHATLRVEEGEAAERSRVNAFTIGLRQGIRLR